MFRKLIYITIAALIFVSCEDKGGKETPTDKNLKEFLTKSQEGAYVKGLGILMFDENIHQRAINLTKNSYRIQNDNQDVYLHGELSSKPTTIGATSTFVVTSQGVGGVSSKAYSVTLEKISGNKMWLWEASSGTGFIIDLSAL